jgi:hypothetical protein
MRHSKTLNKAFIQDIEFVEMDTVLFVTVTFYRRL